MDLLIRVLLTLLAAIATAVLTSKLCRRRLNLPPGPFPFPIFGNWLQVGNNLNYRMFTGFAKEFGDVFLLRMGQRNIAVVSSVDLAREVLLTQGQEFGSRSRNVVYDIFSGKGQDLIFAEYGDHWRKMRRIMTVSLFTNKVVQQYSGDWEDEAAALVEDVRKNPKAAAEGVVLRQRVQRMVYNNVYKIMFNKTFNSEDDELYVKLKKLNGQRIRLGQSLEYNFGDFVPVLRPFLRGYLKRCKELTKNRLGLYKKALLQETFNMKVMGSKGNGVNRGIDNFLKAQQNGEINEDNVLYIVENVNAAGIDTITGTLEWVIAELINNPKIQSKLRGEIDTVVGPNKQVTKPDIDRLPYLQAVIKETLRYRMRVPCLLPHMNLHTAKLGGYDIPAESRVFVNAWWLANDPAHWKNPDVFRPERFLQEESNVQVNGNNIKYIPFGVGRRSCPGIVIAMPILGITVGRLVQNFELCPPLQHSIIDTTENNGQFGMRMLHAPFHRCIGAKMI